MHMYMLLLTKGHEFGTNILSLCTCMHKHMHVRRTVSMCVVTLVSIITLQLVLTYEGFHDNTTRLYMYVCVFTCMYVCMYAYFLYRQKGGQRARESGREREREGGRERERERERERGRERERESVCVCVYIYIYIYARAIVTLRIREACPCTTNKGLTGTL